MNDPLQRYKVEYHMVKESISQARESATGAAATVRRRNQKLRGKNSALKTLCLFAAKVRGIMTSLKYDHPQVSTDHQRVGDQRVDAQVRKLRWLTPRPCA